MVDITERIENITGNIARLENERATEVDTRMGLEKWAELLWLDGLLLEARVREAFDLIGFETESKNPSGHTHDLVVKHGDHMFLCEVTGSTGSIKLDKGRELLQWVLDSPDPGNIPGILVCNPYRLEPPNNRPPSPNHKLYVKELEDLANKYDFALVNVEDLLTLVTARLEGKEINIAKVCNKLSKNGPTKLSVS